ncbi:MAG: alpha/beta fold hydrolase [Pseudomonadota bacterium]
MESKTRRHRFTHRGLSLSYLDSGPRDAAAVLLLHGFPDHAGMWTPQIEALNAAGYRCIAPDTVGCGESAIAPRLRDYNCVRIAGDHAALLDHLELQGVHVVGHDWGAVIGWLLAGHHPARVQSLTALSVGHPTAYARAGFKQKLLGWYTAFFMLGGIAERLLLSRGRFGLGRVFQSHPEPEEVMGRLRQPGRLRAALRIYRAAVIEIMLRRQPDVAAPVLGVWSDGDRFLVERQMTDSEKYCTGPWRYEPLQGHHWMSVQQPDRVNQLILDHIHAAA